MKYIPSLLFFLFLTTLAQGQGIMPTTFYEGKSIVLVSNDPSAKPAFTWQALADSIHPYLVRAGGDPIGYSELEQVALSTVLQAEYAKAFLQRQIQNVVLITRQKEQVSIQVGKFSEDGKIIENTSLFGISGKDWKTASQEFAAYGSAVPTKNLLVPDLAEFPALGPQSPSANSQKFISRNPINLDVFRLGIPLEGTSAINGPINTFRYEVYGKSPETLLAEQSAQQVGLEEILSSKYPYEVAWLVETKTNQELLEERIQFVLVKVEGRQADLMKSMGLEPIIGEDGAKTVVKYYIRFLVREELYLGPQWDAHPDWKVSLNQFLDNLKK
ncbi:MAG: NTPase [Bacteroidetes bacterium]|nr:NTPase [Bacteroidota bacterium]MDA1268385.1 NTPase [Bacteroidota bacterium]